MSAPHRTAGHRTGGVRTGTHRTGGVRTGPLRPGAPRAANRRPELRLVTAPVTRTPGRVTRRAPFVLLVLALLAATTLSLLVLNTAIAVDSLHANALRRDNAKKVEEVQRLERQVISGETPQRLAAAAAAAGMVPAGQAGHLVVQPDGTSTLRGTPSPAPSPSPAPPSAPAPEGDAAPPPAAPGGN